MKNVFCDKCDSVLNKLEKGICTFCKEKLIIKAEVDKEMENMDVKLGEYNE